MLDTLSAGALITAGGLVQRAPVTVEVLRPFLVSGERLEVGTRIALGAQLAAEMIAANKVRIAPPEAPVVKAPEAPAAEQPADDAPRARRRTKESES